MIFNITYRCNLDCSFCATAGLAERFAHPMGLDLFAGALQWLKNRGIRKIALSGGEPTLHPDIGKILGLVKQNGFVCSINTNCTFEPALAGTLDERTVSFVQIHLAPAYFEKASSRKKIERNVSLLREGSIPMQVRYNLNGNSARDSPMLFEFLDLWGIRKLSLSLPAPDLGGTNHHCRISEMQEKHNELIDMAEEGIRRGISVQSGMPLLPCMLTGARAKLANEINFTTVCPAGDISECVLHPDGTVSPCDFLGEFSSKKISGYRDPEEIYAEFGGCLHDLKWQKLLFGKCLHCIRRARKLCQGGCLNYKRLGREGS